MITGRAARGWRRVVVAVLAGSSVACSWTVETRADDAAEDLPFTLAVTPAVVAPGAAVRVSFEGDLSGDWTHGAAAFLDSSVDGEWRTVWALTDDSFDLPPIAVVDSDATAVTFPAIGYPVEDALSFVLPPSVAPGSYRLCHGISRPFDSPAGQRSARLCADLSVE